MNDDYGTIPVNGLLPEQAQRAQCADREKYPQPTAENTIETTK